MEQKLGEYYTESKFGMNTFLRMTSYCGSCLNAFHASWEVFDRIEHLCSRFENTSQLSKINLMAGKKSVRVSEEFLEILQASQRISAFTEGAFDATIGAVTDLWSIGNQKEKVPLEKEKEEAEKLVDYRLIEICDRTVFLPQIGMKLDFGGIAKEFAVHLAAKQAERMGLKAGMIDAGGDICIVGNKPDHQPWRVGIQHPRQQKTLLASITMRNWDTIETSGDYCRFLQKEDFFHGHVFAPYTEEKFGELISVTLVYRRGEELLPINGTAFLVSGLEKSRQLLEKIPEVEAVFVTKAMEVFITEGLKDCIHILPQEIKRQTFVLKRKVF